MDFKAIYMKRDFLDKWLYFLVIIMGIYFIIRTIDQAKMITIFPLVNNDLGSYIAQLHMLKVCGFHNFCPYWYNGFVNFLIASPGWAFFTYPLYLLFNNILFATYISVIIMYLISFVFVYYFGKTQNFSPIKRVAFFILIFANSISLGNFIIMGRMPSLNATVFFLGLAAVIYFYKDHQINKRFVLFFVPLNILVILSHYQEAVLAQILILSLFLIKKGYEKIILALSFVLSLILSAFWWVPFLLSGLNLEQSSILTREQGKWFIHLIIPEIEFTTSFFNGIIIIVLPLALFITFYFYWTSKKKPIGELVFYLPVLTLNLLFWLRITAYMPLFKNVSPDPFLIFFLFFILIFFFKTKFCYYPGVFRCAIIIFLLFLPLANVTISHTKTPYWGIFEYGDIEKETLSLFGLIDSNEKFVFVSSPPSTRSRSYPEYYYAYATVYNNLSTPEGYYYFIPSRDYINGIRGTIRQEKNCENVKSIMLKYNASYAIAYDERCNFLKNCKFEEITTKNRACLYKLKINF